MIVHRLLQHHKYLLKRETSSMKPVNLVLLLALTSGLLACSQMDPMPREQVASNLAPILKIEKQAERVKYYTQILGYIGSISNEKADKLKGHYDIYYFYYLAANFHLARGNTESYLAHVKLAENELHEMETILKDKFAKLKELDLEREATFPRQGL